MASINEKLLAAAAAILSLAGDLYESGSFHETHVEGLFSASAYGGLSKLQTVADQIVQQFTEIEGYSVDVHTVISHFLSDADISTLSEDDTEREKFSALSIALQGSLRK